MKNSLYSLFRGVALLLLLGLAPSLSAQDLTLTCVTAGPRTEGDVTLDYKWYDKGANIYASETMDYSLTVTSTRKIVRIEFIGTTDKGGGVIVKEGGGNLDFHPAGTSVWEGSANRIVFGAASAATDYYVTSISIWFEGSTALCEKPEITFTEDGQLLIASPTPDARCYFTLTPNAPTLTGKTKEALPLTSFTIVAYAEAEGKARSETATRVITLEELQKALPNNEK